MRRPVTQLTSFLSILVFGVSQLMSPLLYAGDESRCAQHLKDLREYLLRSEKERKEPKFSQDDINKMQELAQRPEIKQFTDDIYMCLRNGHQDQAYALNTTTGRNGLYPNPMLQEYINQLGQSLVPQDSANLYTFRIIYDPRPDSFALSTGSVYVTTGMLSMVQNEAQLVYVLGHEVGHVEKNHFYEEVRGKILENALYIEKEKSSKKKGAILGAIAGAAGAIAGGIGGGAGDALNWGLTAGLGAWGLYSVISSFTVRPKATIWEKAVERDADEFGLKVGLQKNFDIREAPKLLVALEQTVTRDPRVGFGFHGSRGNVMNRKEHVQSLLEGTLKEELQKKTQETLIGSSPNFALLMAALQRDNGILALDYDLFELARLNLQQAEAIRSSDPVTQYYLGKVYRLTSRSVEERQKAQHHFLQAIRYDANRGFHPDPYLELALSMIRENDPKLYPEIQKELKTYVLLYQRNNGGSLPENMNILYDYLSMSGEEAWMVPRVVNVSTRDLEPLKVQTVSVK